METPASDHQQGRRRIFLHFVWSTKHRQPLLTPELERKVYRCIEGEVRRFKATVLAIGGTEDHVHMAIQLPVTVAVAPFIKQVKGVSSAFANHEREYEELFRWQRGYAVFSLWPPHLPRVIDYIHNQKRHHAEGKIWPAWEEISEEDDEPTD